VSAAETLAERLRAYEPNGEGDRVFEIARRRFLMVSWHKAADSNPDAVEHKGLYESKFIDGFNDGMNFMALKLTGKTLLELLSPTEPERGTRSA
jgi:hypothetical protein